MRSATCGAEGSCKGLGGSMEAVGEAEVCWLSDDMVLRRKTNAARIFSQDGGLNGCPMDILQPVKTTLTAPVLCCLAATWLVWSTTYLAIRFALEGFAPFFQMGTRFLLAGLLLLAFMALRGARWPSIRQVQHCTVVGGLMMGGGMGLTAYGEQSISSGATTVFIAAMPILIALWSRLFGQWPSKAEAQGMALGTVGVVLLASGSEFRASTSGLLALTGAITCWSLGAVLATRLDIPKGPIGFGLEMLMGGLVLMVISYAAQESWAWPSSVRVWAAWAYLVTAGSLLAFCAYMYLVANVSPALATSYVYVNPPLALGIGMWFGQEQVSAQTWLALPLVLAAVALLASGKKAVPKTTAK
jgi:drug/metabolite transporter (DMT)-like permease